MSMTLYTDRETEAQTLWIIANQVTYWVVKPGSNLDSLVREPVFLITTSYSWVRCTVVAMGYGPLHALVMMWNPNFGEGESIPARLEVHLYKLWSLQSGIADTIRWDTRRKMLTHVLPNIILGTMNDKRKHNTWSLLRRSLEFRQRDKPQTHEIITGKIPEHKWVSGKWWLCWRIVKAGKGQASL